MPRYLAVSGSVFGLIALLHVLRLARGWHVTVADAPVPGWVSILAMLFFGCLAGWAVRLGRRR